MSSSSVLAATCLSLFSLGPLYTLEGSFQFASPLLRFTQSFAATSANTTAESAHMWSGDSKLLDSEVQASSILGIFGDRRPCEIFIVVLAVCLLFFMELLAGAHFVASAKCMLGLVRRTPACHVSDSLDDASSNGATSEVAEEPKEARHRDDRLPQPVPKPAEEEAEEEVCDGKQCCVETAEQSIDLHKECDALRFQIAKEASVWQQERADLRAQHTKELADQLQGFSELRSELVEQFGVQQKRNEALQSELTSVSEAAAQQRSVLQAELTSVSEAAAKECSALKEKLARSASKQQQLKADLRVSGAAAKECNALAASVVEAASCLAGTVESARSEPIAFAPA